MTKPTPTDRLFTEEHEWIKIETPFAIIGISDHAQASLGDVVYVELPSIGAQIQKGKAIGVVESVKAVSDIYAPASGVVKSVNQDVLENPEKINSSPYDEGWLLKIELTETSETKSLLSPKQYDELLTKEAK
jgi:glycine cleavage system H protein